MSLFLWTLGALVPVILVFGLWRFSGRMDLHRSTQILSAASAACVLVIFTILYFHGESSQFERLDRFPVFYRGLGLVVFGLWCWGLNLQGLAAVGINANTTMLADPKFSATHNHRSVYFLASVMTLVYCSNFFFYTMTANMVPSIILPVILFAVFLFALFMPTERLFGDLRFTFLRATVRIMSAPFSFVYFSDVLLADIFTSFAKVFADMATPLCLMFVTPDFEYHQPLHATCSASIVGPILLCLPSFWRLLQCLRQYRDEDQAVKHLLNALKYCTAFPVVIFSALQKAYPEKQYAIFFSELWLISVFISSIYSFYWDVYYDWDLGNTSTTPGHYFLRENLVFKSPRIYYVAIVLDLLLRTSWSLKLSSHLKMHDELSMFVFEVFEIIRRCMWIFIRVEHQYLKEQATITSKTKKTIVMDTSKDDILPF